MVSAVASESLQKGSILTALSFESPCRMESLLLMLLLLEERVKHCRELRNLQQNAKRNPIKVTKLGVTIAYTVQTFPAKYLPGLPWDASPLGLCLTS